MDICALTIEDFLLILKRFLPLPCSSQLIEVTGLHSLFNFTPHRSQFNFHLVDPRSQFSVKGKKLSG